MNDIKKDHSIGAGTGAVGGAVAGAAVGSVVGLINSVVGAMINGVINAKTDDSIAEAVNPTEYNSYFEKNYTSAPYYVGGSEWRDYKPAYQYGYDTYGQYRGQRFEDVENDLERNWDATKANSRLAWTEARGAVRDGWHHIERAMPGDADGDGR